MERLAAIVNYAGLTPLDFARFPLREEGSTEETMMLACRCEPMSARWYSVLSEKEQALILANKILERHGFDPDDELVVIATQFLRERG